MGGRFEGSGVGQPNIDVHVFGENWRRATDYVPQLSESIEETLSLDEERALINKLSMAKPGWFMAMEDDARSFLARFNIHDLPPVYLLPEAPELELFNLAPGSTTYALAEPFLRYALVREQKIVDCLKTDGAVKAASFVVHELSHLALRHSSITFREDELFNEEKIPRIKSGFVYVDHQKSRGFFLEEAFAAYIGGLYVRSKTDDYLMPTSIQGKPRPYVPDHYRFSDDGIESFGGNMTAGPDGYALEMLMWGVEQRGIMDTRTFFDDLLASRNASSQAYGMRNIISAINAIQPDLYKRLSHLAYSKQSWEEGCAVVYEAITGELWPEDAEPEL